MAFSPDGKTRGRRRRFDPLVRRDDRGRTAAHRPKQASDLQFTDGGKTLTAAVMGAIYRWDTATGKSLTPEGWG